MSYIEIHGLSKIYNPGKPNETRALMDASFNLDKGEFVCVLGPSGAGKSTLLNILGGMDRASSGSYIVNDKDVTKFNEKELQVFRRQSVGFVFQFYNLMQDLTSYENVSLASSIALNPLDPKEIIEKVGLEKRMYAFPSSLSGGEQQRVSIARAIVKNPSLLLCDEPTGALDSKTGKSIMALLMDICKKYEKTLILVTHNAALARLADRVIRMGDGHIVSNEINEHPSSVDEIDW
ncbi:MAG: ABC transporter ATP-binding protein [Bacillales bacterium]|nr:ABC transporter ATP-binding protein [Mollicutes bacterium]MCI7213557.1 ABC transporter ATP-binding protein [Bacillales bacterium]MDD7715156.1 ABC transporter ATP-binding protein [Mollicutes bacterium]